MIATSTIEENSEVLKLVFKLLTENLLELRLDKCVFLRTEIDFLGYQISEKGISPNGVNIAAIKNYPVPSNIKEVQRFVGLCSYFRRFVQNFAVIAKPLYDLLRKQAIFKFGLEQIKAFESLRTKLVEQPILAIYSPLNETELHCDISSLGFGSILIQKQEDGRFHPVFFFSKHTTDSESKFHSYELEILAIIYSLR